MFLTMGSPLSLILYEVFLQLREDFLLDNVKKDHDIVFCSLYVDGIPNQFSNKT